MVKGLRSHEWSPSPQQARNTLALARAEHLGVTYSAYGLTISKIHLRTRGSRICNIHSSKEAGDDCCKPPPIPTHKRGNHQVGQHAMPPIIGSAMRFHLAGGTKRRPHNKVGGHVAYHQLEFSILVIMNPSLRRSTSNRILSPGVRAVSAVGSLTRKVMVIESI